MEYTKFNSFGQWTLHKSVEHPYGATPKVDKPFKVFNGKGKTGELHEDHGQKGTLHDFGGGHRPKPTWNKRNIDKVPHPVHSVQTERNPGLGEQEVE